jgi:excisionase family DNA binding protein
MEKALDTNEVSDLLKISTKSVGRLRDSGKLKFFRVGGLVRFSPEDVQAFIDAQRQEERP